MLLRSSFTWTTFGPVRALTTFGSLWRTLFSRSTFHSLFRSWCSRCSRCSIVTGCTWISIRTSFSRGSCVSFIACLGFRLENVNLSHPFRKEYVIILTPFHPTNIKTNSIAVQWKIESKFPHNLTSLFLPLNLYLLQQNKKGNITSFSTRFTLRLVK